MNRQNRNNDSVIDALFSSDTTVVEEGKIEIYIPDKCKQCNNAIICNVLPAAVSFSRIGIKIDIAECPFCNPTTK